MNFLKKFIKASPTDEMALIPSGKLFLSRSPQLPKGALECLYNDSLLAIKRTTTPYCYQLQVIKAYQEGELSSQSADEDDEDDENESSAETPNHDERMFFLSEELKFRIYNKHDGTKVIAWRDLNGDLGDRFEFVVDEEIKYNEVDHFMLTLYHCLYEQKYEKSAAGIHGKELTAEFQYDPKRDSEGEELAITDLSALKNIRAQYRQYRDADDDDDDDDDDEDEADEGERVVRKTHRRSTAGEVDDFKDALNIPYHIFQERLSVAGDVASKFDAQLRIYDPDTEEFKLLADKINVKFVLVAPLTFQLVCDEAKLGFAVNLSQELNPVFNFEHFVFIFNYYSVDDKQVGSAYSLMLKFDSFQSLDSFQKVFYASFYESVTKSAANKARADDMDFVIDALGRFDVSSDGDTDYVSADGGSDDEFRGEDDDERIRKIIQDQVKSKESRGPSLFVSADSEDESDDDQEERKFRSNTYKNSGMAVGQASDRTFVTRGDSLGVYSDRDGAMDFSVAIRGLSDENGNKFFPKSTMLHQRDNALLMTNTDASDTKIHKMDLTRGQIVESWDADGDEKLQSFAPISKYAPLTGEQTLLGISSNSLFHIDPRLSGKKIVHDKTYKKYKTTRNNFEKVTVTGDGYVAVGLQDGALRLYNKLGGNAKTALPALGQNFIGIDVTKDGRWLLATCKTYLLLIDLKIGKGQKNEGANGFEKYFDADKKPVPRRLTLLPEHLAQISRETGQSTIEFTPAKFNTPLAGTETTIVTSSGLHVFTWSLTNIRKNPKRAPVYTIHKYDQHVVADSFKFNSNNEIITALQDEIAVANKQSFKLANKKAFGF